MRLDSLFIFLIQQDSDGCNLSGGVGMREDCDVATCSCVEDRDPAESVGDGDIGDVVALWTGVV
jgi:hypothetical protein